MANVALAAHHPCVAHGTKAALVDAAFAQWFGRSAVTDANGAPLVVYHGTRADFSTFSRNCVGNSNRMGPGFYFTGDKKTFDVYADNSGGRVMPVYLSMQNPQTSNAMSHSQVESFFAALQDKIFPNGYDATKDHIKGQASVLADLDNAFERLSSLTQCYISRDDWFRGMNAAGVDGVIREVYGYPEYVVFSSTQIKSAIGNNGDFNLENADILFSLSYDEDDQEDEPLPRMRP